MSDSNEDTKQAPSRPGTIPGAIGWAVGNNGLFCLMGAEEAASWSRTLELMINYNQKVRDAQWATQSPSPR